MERTVVSGIPTWHTGGEPFAAALHFRVGTADEPLPQAGITRLIASLADRPGPQTNAFVTPDQCVFFAEGDRARVLDHLARVGRTLAALPLDQLEDVRAALTAKDTLEWAMSLFPTLRARMLVARYGIAGHGLGDDTEYGLHWVGPEEVQAWWSAHFTRGNAGLWVVGEPPPDLGFELPDGPRVAPPAPAPLPAKLPAFAVDGASGVALTGVVPHSAAAVAALEIAKARLGEGGHGNLLQLSAGIGHLLLGVEDTLDPEPLWRVARQLAEHGPTAEELERPVPQDVHDALGLRVTHELAGRPFEPAPITAETVTAVFRALLDDALLLGPDGSRAPEGLPDYHRPTAPERGGERFQRPKPGRLKRRPDEELWIGERGLSYRDGEDVTTIAWDSALAGEERPLGRLRVLALDGLELDLIPGYWEDGDRALTFVRERLGAGKRLPSAHPDQLAAIDALVQRRALDLSWLAGAVNAIPNGLKTTERVLDLMQADRDGQVGLLTVTSERLVWVDAHEREQIVIDRPDCRAAADGAELTLRWPYGDLRLTITPPAAAASI